MVAAAPGGWYAKSDGSLSHGVEYVSHPGTLQFWREHNFGWIRKKGFTSYDTDSCGLHIHVSRAPVSCLTTYKLLNFFMKHPGYIHKISRRKKVNLERWAALDDSKGVVLKKAWGDKGTTTRYMALNVEPPKTLEFRLFRGTTEPGSILRNVGWTAGLIYYARDAEIETMAPAGFATWLQRDGAKFLGKKLADDVREWSITCV